MRGKPIHPDPPYLLTAIVTLVILMLLGIGIAIGGLL